MFAAAIFARPCSVRGPELAPPCSRQRPFRLFAGRRHAVPRRVLAPQRCPGQSGPKRVSSPISTLSFAIIWTSPLMGYYFTANFAGLREGPQQVHGQRLLVAGARNRSYVRLNLPGMSRLHSCELSASSQLIISCRTGKGSRAPLGSLSSFLRCRTPRRNAHLLVQRQNFCSPQRARGALLLMVCSPTQCPIAFFHLHS